MANSSKNSRESKSSDTPAASRTNLPAPKQGYVEQFTEDGAKQALINARGDIFTAAQLLGVTALRLHRAVQVSQVLQEARAAIQEAPKAMPLEELHRLVDERVALYRVVGLDALHDLAAMPIDENSAQNQVKLAAAARLAGGIEGGVSAGEMGETLRELAKSYQENAPRLRVIRERLTVEVDPAAIDVTPRSPEE